MQGNLISAHQELKLWHWVLSRWRTWYSFSKFSICACMSWNLFRQALRHPVTLWSLHTLVIFALWQTALPHSNLTSILQYYWIDSYRYQYLISSNTMSTMINIFSVSFSLLCMYYMLRKMKFSLTKHEICLNTTLDITRPAIYHHKFHNKNCAKVLNIIRSMNINTNTFHYCGGRTEKLWKFKWHNPKVKQNKKPYKIKTNIKWSGTGYQRLFKVGNILIQNKK